MQQHIITDTAALESFCQRMSNEPFITVDTEFLREKTYWPQLCLVQVGGANEVAAIDPLVDGIDLTPLFNLLHNKSILKVLHAARQDLEIFFKLTGDVPEPIFDTQVAAQVSGMGESIGYEGLVKKLTGHQLDKTQRITDWSRRPLTDAQIEYALGDVIYLHASYQKLLQDIERRGRRQWIEEDMQMLHDAALYYTPPQEAWKRVKFRASKSIQIARLQRLAAWREQLAQDADVPRTRVIRDDAMSILATNPPKNEELMGKIRGFPQHMRKEWRRQLWEVIEEFSTIQTNDLPSVPKRSILPPEAESKLDMLKLLLKQLCRQEDVSARLVADKDELQWLALGGVDTSHPVLHGWRYDIFGEKALQLLAGTIAIALCPEDGSIRFRAV